MDRHDTLLLGGGTPESRKIIRTVLEENYNLLEAGNARQTLLLLEQNMDCIAAVLLDVTVPEAMAHDLMTSPQALSLMAKAPVIVISGDDDPDKLDRYFSYGASDVIPLHYEPYAMLHRIENLVQLHLHKQNLEQMVREQAEVLRHHNDLMVDALSSIIEYRSVESGQHILRIRHFTRILLEEVARTCPEYGLTESVISIISSAAALHDVGKIGIPDAILTKPGRLTEPEWEIMKTHTTIGCQILESLNDVGNQEYLRYAHNICHYHHERWDGGGYPEGLEEEDIPICAQVVGLADVYDALTSKRVYKEAYGLNTAANMIFNGECGLFSPKLLECFKQVLPRFEELSLAYADGKSPGAERFEVALPGPEASGEEDGIHVLQGKYQSLLHYINAFVLEVAVDQGFFHLFYNPYPELGVISRASNFMELEQIILEEIVVPEDAGRMRQLIHSGIREYLQAGMRRQSFRFRFRKKDGGAQPYELTLLRANVNQKQGRSLTVLCRKLTEEETASGGIHFRQEYLPELVGSSFCCRNDRDFTLIRMTGGVESIAGYSRQELLSRFGGKLAALIHPEDQEAVRDAFRQQLNQSAHIQTEFRVVHRDGQPLWVMYEGRLVTEADGQECLYSYITDISNTRRAYEALMSQMNRYEIILGQTENALFDWNLAEDTVVFSNNWKKVFGFDSVSGNVREILKESTFLHPDDVPLLLDGIQRLDNGSAYEMLEVRIATDQARYLWCRFRASAIRDDQGALTRVVGLIVNIDAEKQAERALQDRAERDALTRLLNKDAGRRQAEDYLRRFPEGVKCALLIIDMDNFKEVNDRFGHLYGDSILTRAADEIRKIFRAQDIVARIGGDEFMVLMRGASSRSLVENRCRRLLGVFQSAFRESGPKLPISCSIGIALSPEHGSTYVELFQRADQALYCAKDRGRDTYVFYSGADAAFRSWNARGTAVSNRIDSDDQPGLADGSLVQYAFQRLYSSRDMDASIHELLSLMGHQTNVSRVYVFENSADNRYCSNTYEWCNTGVDPEIDNLQNVSYETDIPNYERNFDENGIFYCPDVRQLPQHLYDIVAPQGIRSMLHCAIRDNGVFRGYIGFDDCRNYRLWTQDQIDLLTYFSEMLSVFLLKMRSQERVKRRADDLQNILDNQNGWVYIVDPETRGVQFLNAKLRRDLPEDWEGKPCYQCLARRDTPCPGCPMERLDEKNQDTVLLTTNREGAKLLAEATRIRWEDAPACMLNWRRLPEE